MSVTRTFTVTVVSTGSGNKYFIDGVQQATLILGEGGTYKFDQSDSSNGNHPLRFATSEDASGGSQYTTGVTANGTPGQAGAYTQIVVAESAPTLYYYCTNHSGMGGQANTVEDNTWGMWAWSTNEWGDQGPVEITLSGQSATSSLGSVVATPSVPVELTGQSSTSSVGSPNLDITSVVSLTAPSGLTTAVGSVAAANISGWGRQEWGNSGWGVNYAVELSGQQATSSNGSVTTFDAQPVSLTGVSSTASVGSPTLDLTSVISLTGQTATSEVGDFDNAGTLVGWGRNGWGEEPYGDSFNKLVQLAGLSTTSSVGSLTAAIENFVFPTGVSATSSVGSLTPIIDCVVVPTGVSATSNVGSIDPIQGIVGLTGISMTSTVGGIILDAIEIGLTGVSATSSVGSLQQQISEILTGQQATTSLGSLTLEIGVSLTGVSSTAAVGTITPSSMTVGLDGQELISSVGNVAPLGYGDVDITGNTSYNAVNKTNSASYSDVDVTGNTSYTDVTHVA